ncbi:hypothetical protein CBR_g463 [Chara braunii]|uniref:Uncharacterized protein n=1 Tax=Chara braunii TaxID=69332 RepID=A0A388KB87_CHABU|nr:hypothetical protein CBR_g463 [Chara braunii]|eukprot:GBG67324.1 hypothetical protein CBR_g463 [Chara braunii]
MHRQHEGGKIDGGAISMEQWLEDRIQELLDILWELEDGPDPRLRGYIDWRRADDRLAACRTLFTLGRDLCNQLEYRHGLLADEDDCSKNISYSDINDRDGVNNNNDGGGDVHGCSTMGEIQQVDAEDNGDVNNNNNNNNINYSNNNKNDGAQGLGLGEMGKGDVKVDTNINNDGENNNDDHADNNNNNMMAELREERVTNHRDAMIDSDEYKGGDGEWWVDLMSLSYQVMAKRAAVGDERKHAFDEAGEGEVELGLLATTAAEAVTLLSPLCVANENTFGTMLKVHPMEKEGEDPELGSVRFDIDVSVKAQVKPRLVVGVLRQGDYYFEVVTAQTAWCNHCREFYHDAKEECPGNAEADPFADNFNRPEPPIPPFSGFVPVGEDAPTTGFRRFPGGYQSYPEQQASGSKSGQRDEGRRRGEGLSKGHEVKLQQGKKQNKKAKGKQVEPSGQFSSAKGGHSSQGSESEGEGSSRLSKLERGAYKALSKVFRPVSDTRDKMKDISF